MPVLRTLLIPTVGWTSRSVAAVADGGVGRAWHAADEALRRRVSHARRRRRCDRADERPVNSLARAAVAAGVLAAVPARSAALLPDVTGGRVRPARPAPSRRWRRVGGERVARRRPDAARRSRGRGRCVHAVHGDVEVRRDRELVVVHGAPEDVDVRAEAAVGRGDGERAEVLVAEAAAARDLTSRTRTRGVPSFHTRICESRWKQSANFAVMSAWHDWLMSTESELVSRTSMPTGRYGCPQPPYVGSVMGSPRPESPSPGIVRLSRPHRVPPPAEMKAA